jgi:trimeric autotransporter adhesin
MLNSKIKRLCFFAALALGPVMIGQAQDIKVWATASQDGNPPFTFGTFDLTTAVFTQIAVISPSISSLTVGPAGTIYGGATDGNIYTITPTGATARFGTVNDSSNDGYWGLASQGSSGFFAVDDALNFFHISPDGTTATSLGSLGAGGIGGSGTLAFGPDGNLYYNNYNPSPILYKVNTTNGALTQIGTTLTSVNVLTMDTSGTTLYGVDTVVSNPNFYSINIATGVATRIGTVTGLPSGDTLDTMATMIQAPVYVSDSENDRIRGISSGIIDTVAGDGTQGFSGDGGPAPSAELDIPFGVAADPAGDVFIADTQNNRIRKVSPTGTITTVAGSGTPGFSGDGGPAISASLNHPMGVALDSSGNIYIADEYNNRIREVSTTGTITTVAGSGGPGNSGDGGPATSAQLYYPTGIAVDGSGNLFIADSDNNRVRKVSAGIITTVAGNGNAGFSCANGSATGVALHTPQGVAVDAAGDLFIADYGNQCIRKVSGGSITTVAGNGLASFSGDGGPATSASLNYPTGVAVDSFGNLYIADFVNNRIRMVNAAGTISTFAGTGKAGFSGDGGLATNAWLYEPSGVAVLPPVRNVAP